MRNRSARQGMFGGFTGHVARTLRMPFGALLALSPIVAAQAQSPPEPSASESESLEMIVVTGSRIARTGFSAPTPVSVLSADRLEQRAATNIGEALNELPAFRGTQTPSSQGLAGGYIGGRVLDLRGLGTLRTLTLLDGKRFVPSTLQGTVDTNMIPSGLIERAEVVTGGASAAYGSDAVAGVVNFIVNERMTGFKTSLEYGISSHSDDETYAGKFSGGVSLFGGRVNVIAAADFEKNDGVGTCIERDWCADEYLNFGPVGADRQTLPANNILPDVRPSTIAPGGVINDTALRGLTFNPDGSARPFVYGSPINSLFMVGGEGEGRNGYFEGIPIKSATERVAFYTRTRVDLTDSLVGRFDLSYGHLKGNHFAGQARNTASPLNTTARTIRRDNAFLPTSADPQFDIPSLMDAAGVTSFQLGRHYADFGNPSIESNNGTLRAVAELSGPLFASWDWDAYYQYGSNRYRNETSNNIINARMALAYDAVLNPAGQPVCRVNADADPANDNPACVALNPFGNQIDPAAWDFVTGTSRQTNRTTEHVVAGNVQGDLFSLWAGPIGVATGIEYRSDKIDGGADAISQSLGFFGNNASQVSGQIDVIEGYLETAVPLASDVFLAKNLEASGAVRRTKYDRDGANSSSSVYATTWKVGATWSPIESLRFRATKSRDIRAPNVSELFGPTTSAFGILNDPALGGAQTNPAVRSGSNPTLIPEEADTRALGVVIQPQMDGVLGRMQMSVDYYKIEIDDAIGVLGAQTIVTRCFEGAAEFCPLITRDPVTNVVTLIQDVSQNVNKLITSGIDVEWAYRQQTDNWGNFDVRLMANIVSELTTIDSGGPLDRAGQTGLRGGTLPGLPDYTLDGLLVWRGGAVQGTLHARYIPSGIYNVSFIGPDDPRWSIALGNSSNTNSVPSATYFDLGGQYDFSINGGTDLVAFATVNNVFDKDPPRVPGANGSGNNVLFDAVGRVYKVGVRMEF